MTAEELTYLTDDPYRAYASLRACGALVPITVRDQPAWFVGRYADVSAILKNPDFVVARRKAALLGLGPDEAATRLLRNKMGALDPPDHTRLRRLVAPGFTPAAAESFRLVVRAVADRLLDELAPRPVIDIAAEYAARVPAAVICQLAGVPEEDWRLLVATTNDFLPLLSPFVLDPESLERGRRACEFYFRYFGAVIDRLRHEPPRDDVLGRLISAEVDGERLRRNELIAMMEAFINAGYETTMSSIGNAVVGLADQPDSLLELQHHPGLIPNAFEEVLRWQAPVHFTFRWAARDLDIAGTSVACGDWIVLGLASGNYDENVFPEPRRINVHRPAVRHLSFGGGRHFCLGAHLSRVEGQEAMSRFLRRFPAFTLDEPPIRRADPLIPAIEHLRVRLNGVTAA